MGAVKECWTDRQDVCAQEQTNRVEECIEERDLGYNRCTEERDEGYNKCCDWIPCSWVCKAVVWISNIVCVAWEWVQNIVCVVTSVFETVACVLWTTVTSVICLSLPMGTILVKGLDGLFHRSTALVRNLIAAPLNAIAHPIRTADTLISYFQGCPDVSYILPSALQIISHHGYTKAYPENTIKAFRVALTTEQRRLKLTFASPRTAKLCFGTTGTPTTQ